MKFFKFFRNRKNQNLRNTKVFLEMLRVLNSDLATSFESAKYNTDTIYSDLEKEDLTKIKIPNDASFEWDPNESYHFGNISVFFNSVKYTIYAKGYGPY